jgi:hypothetical protein
MLHARFWIIETQSSRKLLHLHAKPLFGLNICVKNQSPVLVIQSKNGNCGIVQAITQKKKKVIPNLDVLQYQKYQIKFRTLRITPISFFLEEWGTELFLLASFT